MSFVRRTAAHFTSPAGPAASAADQRKGSDLHPIIEDYGSFGGRETDGSGQSGGGLSTSATVTNDDGEATDHHDVRARHTATSAGQMQMHDLKGVQRR